jgi:2-succinyl-5-enolpyruvyl-6-hydroxy-3-cyclohexene-1-carboxylate synthase
LFNGHVNSKEPNNDLHLIQAIRDWMVKLDNELSITTNLEVVHGNSEHNQNSQNEKLSNRNLNAFHSLTNCKLPEVFNDLKKNLLKFKISHEVFADKILDTNKKAFERLCKVKSINALTIAQFQYVNIIKNWMNDNNKLFIGNDNITKDLETKQIKRKKRIKKIKLKR